MANFDFVFEDFSPNGPSTSGCTTPTPSTSQQAAVREVSSSQRSPVSSHPQVVGNRGTWTEARELAFAKLLVEKEPWAARKGERTALYMEIMDRTNAADTTVPPVKISTVNRKMTELLGRFQHRFTEGDIASNSGTNHFVSDLENEVHEVYDKYMSFKETSKNKRKENEQQQSVKRVAQQDMLRIGVHGMATARRNDTSVTVDVQPDEEEEDDTDNESGEEQQQQQGRRRSREDEVEDQGRRVAPRASVMPRAIAMMERADVDTRRTQELQEQQLRATQSLVDAVKSIGSRLAKIEELMQQRSSQ
ncbi:unnamed protein product [Absidia cylindrospora]